MFTVSSPQHFFTCCLWVRWGRRPAALVRTTVQRLRASRCSFTFCGAAARPQDARVCLSHRGRVFCVGESQSVDDLNKWALFLVSPFILETEHVAFVTESIWVQGENLQRPSSSSETDVAGVTFWDSQGRVTENLAASSWALGTQLSCCDEAPAALRRGSC